MNARKVKKMSIMEAGYLAGLIDGEGTITLTHKQKRAHRHLAITISSTEFLILKYVLKITGVGNMTNKRTYEKNHSPSFTYKVHSRQALDILKQINVFLRSYKKERAKLALKKYILVTPRNGKYSSQQLKARMMFDENFLQILPAHLKIK